MSKNEPTVRFVAGTPGGAKSTTWRCWTKGKGTSDIYLAPRLMTGTYKLSLHESGQWQVGLTSTFKERMQREGRWTGGSRLQAQFFAPKELMPGFTLAFRVLITFGALSLEPTPESLPSDLVWLPPPPRDKVVEVALVLTEPGTKVDGWPGRRAMGNGLVGDFGLDSGKHLWLVHRQEALPNIPLSRGAPSHFTPGPEMSENLTGHVMVVLLHYDGQPAAFMEGRVDDQRPQRDVSA